MRSKKGPSVFCRPTGGAAEQGGGHEGVVGNDGSGGSRGQYRAEVRAWVAGRVGPHLGAFGRVIYGVQASSIDRCARPALPSVPPCTYAAHNTRPDARCRAGSVASQVSDGITGDNGQSGRVGRPPARPPVRSSDSTTSREPNDNDHALEPGRDKDERATARAGRVKPKGSSERRIELGGRVSGDRASRVPSARGPSRGGWSGPGAWAYLT